MLQKINRKLIFCTIFACLICITSFLLVGCGDYYESEDYLNLSTKQKIVEVLKREGVHQDDYYIYQTNDSSGNSSFETTFAYNIIDDMFILMIDIESNDSPGYKETFATWITENTYNVFVGEITYYGIEIASGGGRYNRAQLLELSSLSITTYEGDETYRDIAGTFAALGLKIGVLQIHNALYEFGIDFLGTYFS